MMDNNFGECLVRVDQGLLRGYKEGGLSIFKGIPFARAPVGELRWRPPVPPERWMGERLATQFGGEAVQVYKPGVAMAHNSEDCLYLNVWSPAKVADEKLPVMVWIHGGAYNTGAGSRSMYQSESLASIGNIIVVTINYRVGIFGFFAHPGLTRENDHQSSGNYGLLDQLAALKWVKRNIASFGGDADKITIAGQSAGAGSVGALVASPLAKGLFCRAIIQSGPMFGKMLAMQSLDEGERLGLDIQKRLDAFSLAELREREAWELFEAFERLALPSRPIVDGLVLPMSPAEAVLAGRHNHVDILTGCTSDEFGARPDGVSPEKFEAYVVKTYGMIAQKILSLYPRSTRTEAAKAFIRLTSDAIFLGTLALAEKYREYEQNKAYVYYFTRKTRHEQAEIYGAPHSAELPYLFKRVGTGGPLPWDKCEWTGGDLIFSDSLISFWSSFVKNGVPGGIWEDYNSSGFVLELGEDIAPLDKEQLSERLALHREIAALGLNIPFNSQVDLN